MPIHATLKPPLNIALIGFGAIGAELYRELGKWPARVQVQGALVTGRRPEATASGLSQWVNISELLDSAPDIVVECAGHAALDAYGEQVLRAGHDLLLVSAGALADAALQERLIRAASEGGSQMLLASGAVGGIDMLGAARLAGLSRVHYRSRKPPSAWRGTAAADCLDLEAMGPSPKVFFSGTGRMAALAYPQNANAAATVCLAGLGLDDTQVELIADPGVGGPVHEIEAEGAAGRFSMRFEGQAAAANPKTSVATAFSLARVLLNRRTAMVV